MKLPSPGVVGSAGVADLDVTQLRDLYQWASKRVKPTTNQLHFESAIALSAEMTEFAAEYNIQLLTHADEIGTAGPVNVKRMLDGFKGTFPLQVHYLGHGRSGDFFSASLAQSSEIWL